MGDKGARQANSEQARLLSQLTDAQKVFLGVVLYNHQFSQQTTRSMLGVLSYLFNTFYYTYLVLSLRQFI